MSTTKKIILKIAGYIAPFKFLFILTLILNSLVSFLSVLSIALIKPIFEIIFADTASLNITAGQPIAPADIENNLSFIEGVKQSFFDYVSSVVVADNTDMQTSLLRFGLLIFCVFLVKNIIKYFATINNIKFEESVIKHIRDSVFEKLSTLSLDFFNRNKAGELISIITNDIWALNSSTMNAFNVAFREVIQIVMYVFLLLAISVKLTLTTLFAGIIILVVVNISTKYLRRYAKRIQEAMASFTTTMSEVISGIRVIKAFNGEQNAVHRFRTDTQSYIKSAIKHQKVSAVVPGISELAAIGALCVVLYQGGLLILSNTLGSADLMLFLFSVFAVMAPISNTINALTQFQRGYVAAERVFRILDQKPTITDGEIEKATLNQSIEFKNVSFKYIDKIVLKNINLKIEKGTQVAFVGSSGSGKSTMLDLLIRFYDPTQGQILIDGVDIKECHVKKYRAVFGVVSQENILFNDSVKNNISFGYSNYTEADMEQVACISNSYNFIMSMANGFETQIGDRGVNVSGGERQRIAISRALLRKPQVLIFDEATSSLDAESEQLVQTAINNSLENKTAVIVAHRLSTIINCSKIVVFEQGQIVEQGTHSELLALNGTYANLYNLQYRNGNDETINNAN